MLRSRLMTPPFGVTLSSVILIVAMQASHSVSAQEPATFKVIPTAGKYSDVSTENLSGDARSAARRRNSEARKTRNAASKAAREGIETGNMVPVKDYLNGFIFPRMTQPQQLNEASALRDSFFRTYMKSSVSAANRKTLISEVIMPVMTAIATSEEYAPAARLNAVALIGRLDESALSRDGTRVIPPKPSPLGFDFLSNLLTDANVPAWLKASSIQGLIRHLKVDAAVSGRLLNDNQRDALETFALNTLDGKSAGQDTWDADLDYWLKRRSIQLLGAIGRAGQGDRVIKRLTQTAADTQQRLWLQFDAVKALRSIDFSLADQTQISAVMLTVTEFLQQQLSAEGDRIDVELEDLIYKNILYQDVDFVANGSKYPKNMAKSNQGMGRLSDMEEMNEQLGPMGPNGVRKPLEPIYLVELPTYQLNLIRRRMKVFAFTANDVLQNAKGIQDNASAKDKQLSLALNKFTEKFMKDSSLGLVDVSKEEELDPNEEPVIQRESFSSQLQAVCQSGAKTLQNISTRYKGGNAAADNPEGQPEQGGADPFGVN